MDCKFTEEVSLLVDGELAPHEAARLRAHVDACAACRQARESFLLLRQQLRSYEFAPDPHAQSNALAAILNSRASAPRETKRRLSERLAEAFGVRHLRPAHFATLALLLVAAALGLRWLAGSYNSDGTQRPSAPALVNTNSVPAHAPIVAEDKGERQDKSEDFKGPAVDLAQKQKPARHAEAKPSPRLARENAQVRRDDRRTRDERREGPGLDSPPDVARAGSPASPASSSASAAAQYALVTLGTAAADPSVRIGRHAERVERLLRSFRNSRLSESDPTLDVADARRLSKRLLYSNIALRREAAGAGDPSVRGWLDSLEPILLDISNLPNRPSPGAVGSIKERIRRRQLVGVLQAQTMQTSRP
jgi:negative regulator of sigma E activity